MFLNISKSFIILSLFSVLIVTASLFFPFVSAKIIFFRVSVELAVLFFALHFIFAKDFWAEVQKIKSRLNQPILIAATAFTVVFLLAAILGVNSQFSFWSNFERGEGAFQMIHYFLFFALIVFLFSNKNEILDLLKFNLGISFAVSLYALAQRLIASKILANPIFGFIQIYGVSAPSAAASGPFGNTSYLSAYLLMSIVMGLFLLFRAKTKTWKIIISGVLIFEALILLQAQTRGVFLGIFVALIAFIIINVFVVKQSARIRPYLIALLILMLLLPIFLFLARDSALKEKLPLINRLTDTTTLVYRSWTWGSAIAGFIEKPILGWGAENFPFVFDKYYDARHYGRESFFDRSHNIFLDHLINGGIILLIAYLSIFYFYYRALFKLEKNFEWSILFTAPISYLIQGFFLFEVLPIYMVLFLFLGFFINFFMEKPVEHAPAPLFSAKRFFLAALASALVILLIYFGSYIPLRKNLILKKGFYEAATSRKMSERIQSFIEAVDFKSPVGLEESSATLFFSSKNFLYTLKRTKDLPPKNAIDILMKLNNEQYDRHEQKFIGIRNLYLNAFLNLEAANLTQDKSYLARGKTLLEKGLETAPTRLELLVPLIDVAEFEKDEDALKAIKTKIGLLRPDLQEKLELQRKFH